MNIKAIAVVLLVGYIFYVLFQKTIMKVVGNLRDKYE